MNSKHPNTPERHFQSDIILLCVRWYLRYPLSYRNLEEMIIERGLNVDHTTIYRWVQDYAPELDKRARVHLRPTNDSWRVDETYIARQGRVEISVSGCRFSRQYLGVHVEGCVAKTI